MRARWLKPEFFTDKKIASMGPVVALVYQALWCMADDGGTAPCDADTVKAQMFYRWSAVGVPEITGALHALSASGRIVCYTVGDDTYAHIAKWNEHQQVHKPSKFRHPSIAQGVALQVPEQCGTGAALLPASPPPRHLDTKTPTSPRKAAGLQTWLTPFDGPWREKFGGSLPAGVAAKALKPLVDQHGSPEVERRWANYLAVATAQYASVPRFASTWSRWDSADALPEPRNDRPRVLAATEMLLT